MGKRWVVMGKVEEARRGGEDAEEDVEELDVEPKDDMDSGVRCSRVV